MPTWKNSSTCLGTWLSTENSGSLGYEHVGRERGKGPWNSEWLIMGSFPSQHVTSGRVEKECGSLAAGHQLTVAGCKFINQATHLVAPEVGSMGEVGHEAI